MGVLIIADCGKVDIMRDTRTPIGIDPAVPVEVQGAEEQGRDLIPVFLSDTPTGFESIAVVVEVRVSLVDEAQLEAAFEEEPHVGWA